MTRSNPCSGISKSLQFHCRPAVEKLEDRITPTPASNIIAVGTDVGFPARVRVYDAATQSLKFDFLPFGGFPGGVRVATGDVTGDNVDDIVTGGGIGGGPHVKVFDGTNGVEIRSFFAYDTGFHGGVYVAAADVTMDGNADIITGAGMGGGPHVKVFDGVTGLEIRSFFAYDVNFQGGVRVAGGDTNGDGFADIITAAGPGGGPHIKVVDGVTSAVIQSFFAYSSNFSGGVYVSAGDVNGDGNDDVIVGAGFAGGAHVKSFDGVNAGIVNDFFAYDFFFFGGVRVGAANVNGDQFADIVTGPGPGLPREIKLFNPLDQNEIDDFFAFVIPTGLYVS